MSSVETASPLSQDAKRLASSRFMRAEGAHWCELSSAENEEKDMSGSEPPLGLSWVLAVGGPWLRGAGWNLNGPSLSRICRGAVSPSGWASCSHLHKGSSGAGPSQASLQAPSDSMDGGPGANDSRGVLAFLSVPPVLEPGAGSVPLTRQIPGFCLPCRHPWGLIPYAHEMLPLQASCPHCRQEDGGKAKGMAHGSSPFESGKQKAKLPALAAKGPGRWLI